MMAGVTHQMQHLLSNLQVCKNELIPKLQDCFNSAVNITKKPTHISKIQHYFHFPLRVLRSHKTDINVIPLTVIFAMSVSHKKSFSGLTLNVTR